MNEIVVNKLVAEYGVLGIVVVLFATVIKILDSRHQATILRIEKEKNMQLAELKEELREMKKKFDEFTADNHITIRQNTQTLERNNDLVQDVRHLLREILEKRLDS